ncbi:hypothetical protein SLEP1_g26384 [Rubroshorea leprosula]|uniref:Uncharacterized protein n=1 Tax=Rubroshorea leprosula TaxID=152421 RepID=A0AAV5JLX0_9ROSI|nr:hypothetical protein SLEP1_g26384 [Rubroshorea leprosula]
MASGHTYMNYPTLVPNDVDLKNKLLDYVKAEGLVDLEALVTPEQLVVFGFVDIANLYAEGRRAIYSAENDSDTQLVQSVMVRSFNVPSAFTCDIAKALPIFASTLGPQIAYLEGFSYTKTNCQAAMLQVSSFVHLWDLLTRARRLSRPRIGGLRRDRSTTCRAPRWSTELRQLRAELTRVEWLVDSDMFQDTVVVASMNTTIEIYNDIHGKVLKHRPDFSINELAFFEGQEVDEQGKKEREDLEGLPSFDAWVAGAPEAEVEPSSTPPMSQAVTTPAHPSPARADASIPMDLTDD